MPLNLDNLRTTTQALADLLKASEDEKRMAQLTETERNGIRAGVIQHFKVVYEVAWQLIRRWLNANVTPSIADGLPRRQLYRLAAENKLIADACVWMRYHEARNKTSHAYNGECARKVYQETLTFAEDAAGLLRELEARND